MKLQTYFNSNLQLAMNRYFILLLFVQTFLSDISLPSASNHPPHCLDQGDKYLSFVIKKRFLILPVEEDSQLQRVNIKIDGKYFVDFDMALCEKEEPDYFVFIDLKKYRDQELEVFVPKMIFKKIIGLRKVRQVDTIPGFDSLYQEALRPKFHFSTKRGVIGDPNGLVYHDGLYHLYHQHNPFGNTFHNMHWGHATSKDLIHWTQHDEAIRPASYRDNAWSGSAVVDHLNSSGFQSTDKPPIVAAYTSSRRGECIVYSNDGGMSFSSYLGNPVLGGATANRDPKIFWYEPGKHWVMARNYTFEKKEYIGFYSSSDLKNWTLESKEGFFHSCPEAYELPVIGMEGVNKWVIHDMFGNYKIGSFDGKKFTSEVKEKIIYNHGSAYVAGQNFNNHPDNQVVLMAFSYNGACPGMPFNNCMLFPVELRLKMTSFGIRMCPKPIEAINTLHDQSFEYRNKSIPFLNKLLKKNGNLGNVLHIKMKMGPVSKKFTMELNGATITIERDSLFCKGNMDIPVKPIMRTAIDHNGVVKGPLSTNEGVELELLLDKTTLEIFGNDGALYMPVGLYIYPDFMGGLFGKSYGKTDILPFMDPDKRGITLFSEDESLNIEILEIHTMKSIWN